MTMVALEPGEIELAGSTADVKDSGGESRDNQRYARQILQASEPPMRASRRSLLQVAFAADELPGWLERLGR
ncbi:hypothetical protein LQG66_13195 [Bradyrhizobium ontarionense]|uniref:Uncharacterized protein n=1 Tax=Bradyrhizobium ontarionense TaxID=2898149 RepID=A0ABY3RI88_9BRAD|nr:hypothetical protein [Bradyrhizobium sp. A19]UFZ07195.1 hypothetical protein LQG66_13195 [Bradyrhizobium sp. A19]